MKPSIKTLVDPLLRWYGAQARDLPWRRTTDPYAIWIAEIMLQQTQVRTVLPYWERWMRHLPNIRAVARAKPELVLKLWEGLGYYARVRNLRRAAELILARHRGVFPSSYAEIQALPGIGRYTAGAICSIAFNQPVPIVDGNVTRVLTRVLGVLENPRLNRTNRQLWAWAERMVTYAHGRSSPPARNCSDFNQALMELGATVCTPRQPKCPACPWQQACAARRNGRTETIPHRPSRDRTVRKRVVAFVIAHAGRFLVRQRPAGVVNAQLWEFPNQEMAQAPPPLAELARRCLGFRVRRLEPLCQIEHTITRSRIKLAVYRGTASGWTSARDNSSRWCSLPELEALAFPSAHRKIVRFLTS